MQFQTKARNLASLREYISKRGINEFKVLPLIYVPKGDLSEMDAVVRKVQTFAKENQADLLIIRSSSHNEDKQDQSNAGAFLSVGDVIPSDTQMLESSLTNVSDSMDEDRDNEILVQPMLENIDMHGVAFSYDKDTRAPYFMIEYDDAGSRDSVTGGSIIPKSYVRFRNHDKGGENNALDRVVGVLMMLEEIYDHSPIDVEFAVVDDDIYVLQVRPLGGGFEIIDIRTLQELSERLISLSKSYLHLHGDRAIFGVMPDWNPAEIIGLRPKRLSLSLYRELVTDSVWAYQRDSYGYKNLRSHPLMHSFLGLPYIDVRVSFNSFVPGLLDENISSKLVNFYLDKLANNPHLHDKVESKVVYGCYDLNVTSKLKTLSQHGFNENEIKRIEFALLELTNRILDPTNGLYKKDLNKIQVLKGRHENIIRSNISDIAKIYWLLEECKRFGTLPFAGIARAAFISVQILNSLVEIGFLSDEERQCFLRSLHTISKSLSTRLHELQNGQVSKREFLDEFGHLRAGTYDIMSPSYEKSFDQYFDMNIRVQKVDKECFTLSKKRLKELDVLLIQNGLRLSATELFEFIKNSIEGREYAKFVFTRSLSKAIDLLESKAMEYDIKLEDFAHLDYKIIKQHYSAISASSLRDSIMVDIENNKKEYELTRLVKLPPLITHHGEIFCYQSHLVSPNFIGDKKVTAEIATEFETQNPSGKIALIQAADPGYDFLFTKGIAALVTCYGGANSHMAIRASEMGLPACIGIGEERFQKLKSTKRVCLDCHNKVITAYSQNIVPTKGTNPDRVRSHLNTRDGQRGQVGKSKTRKR